MRRSGLGGPAFSFWAKAAGAVALVAAADLVFYDHRLGAAVGGFALLCALVTAGLSPALRRNRAALFALAAAVLLAAAMIDRPTLVGWLLFWIALTSAVLLPRSSLPASMVGWARRLALHGILSMAAPLRDWLALKRLRGGEGRPGWRTLLSVAVLPLGGGAVFLALFAAANPIIGDALARLRLPSLDLPRAVFWLFCAVVAWATLRPPRRLRSWAFKLARPAPKTASTPAHLSVAGVTLALIVFNALFALENGLDLAFLWSGAGLPDGLTLAQYAHRGAYPLVATALLAGTFSLFFLREGSASAAQPWARRLVGLWVAQNLFLVASSILRTLLYVQAYSLTRFRILALLWMGLVALGLALIGWRMLRGKSGAWLVNANAISCAAVLALVSVVDIGELAADWNVRHARDAGGRGAELDLCYLSRLGPSALRPLLALEREPVGADLHERAVAVRTRTAVRLREQQVDWHGWTPRAARRLAAVQAALGREAFAEPQPPAKRGCDGSRAPQSIAPKPPQSPPAPAVTAPTGAAALTRSAQP